MIKAVLFILAALVLCIVLKNVKSGMPPLISLFVIAVLSVMAVSAIMPTVDFINLLAEKVNLNSNYLKIILKCVGVCYLSSICSNICKDCGESTLAYSSEIICKCSVISLTLPIYMDVFNWIVKLWENI